jgi:CheY-like chemotaxis protein
VTATAEPAAAPAVAPTPGDVLRGASVLVVEDEEALASAIGEALQDAGMKVDIAGDGEDALARIRGGRYDTVICDLKMPRVSGMVIYRAIAAGRRRSPAPWSSSPATPATADAERCRERLPLAGQTVPHRRCCAPSATRCVIDDHRGRPAARRRGLGHLRLVELENRAAGS